MIEKIMGLVSSFDLAGMSRRNLIILVGVFAFIMFVGAVCLLSGGEEEAVDEGVVEPMLPESEIHEFVLATIEAYYPTEVPTPTPDVGATVTAELYMNRSIVPAVVELSPLDYSKSRNPYLSEGEVLYLERLGPLLWDYVTIWLLMREVLEVSPDGWTVGFLEADVSEMEELVEESGHFDFRTDSVGETVGAFGESISDAFRRMDGGVSSLSRAVGIVEVGSREGLDTESENELLLIESEVRRAMAGFDEVMSSYGCSACGELFRSNVEE